MKPLSRAFNVAVVTMANKVCPMGYDVAADDAPHSLPSLKAHIQKTGRMLVWSGASDKTIFACPETNWAFRAWHDWTHYRYNYPITDKGAALAGKRQQSHIRAQFGEGLQTEFFCSLIHFEIIEQLDYKNTFGQFPDDQMALAKSLGYDRAVIEAKSIWATPLTTSNLIPSNIQE